jgi:hypothetical protein
MMLSLRKHLEAARDINPMNDWFLARMVAIQFITFCIIIIGLKN